MGLDALIAYRLPALNMSPLHQIVAPVMPGAPNPDELESALASTLASKDPPRIRSVVSGIQKYRSAILAPRRRLVSVANLGRSDARRVGNECVITCKNRWWRSH